MSPSTTFWIDTSVSLGTGVTALALLFLMLGTGLRQRLNQTFSLFAVATALVGFGSSVANISFWLNSRNLTDSGGFGNPISWMELAAAGYFFIGPTLLSFSITFVEAFASPSQAVLGQAPERGPTARMRSHKILAATGFLVGFALMPAVFGHQIITEIYFDQAHVLQWKLSALGQTTVVGPFLLQLLTFILFWRYRQRVGGRALAISTITWLLASTLVAFVNIPFPIESIALFIAILIAGFVVTNRQIFHQPESPIEQLEISVSDRRQTVQYAEESMQKPNVQLEHITQISREIVKIADPDAIPARLVELLHDRIGYNDVRFYQPDIQHQSLILQAAAGPNAQMLFETKPQLQIGGRSLAGQAAAEHRSLIARATTGSTIPFDGAVSADLRTEMVVPLLVGDRLLGILDVQCMNAQVYSDEDLGNLNSLADVVASTLNNVRSLKEAKAAITEMEYAQRQLFRQAWQATISDSDRVSSFIYAENAGVAPASPSTACSPELSRAATEGLVLTSDSESNQATVALPITFRDQIIGALQLCHKSGRTWQPEDISVLNEVTEKLGLALEKARLAEEAQRSIAHEQLIGEITARIRQNLDVDSVLRTTVREIGEALQLNDVTIRLSTDNDQSG